MGSEGGVLYKADLLPPFVESPNLPIEGKLAPAIQNINFILYLFVWKWPKCVCEQTLCGSFQSYPPSCLGRGEGFMTYIVRVCVCLYSCMCICMCVYMCVLAYIIKRVHSGMLLNRTTMIYTMSWCNVRRVILGVMLPKTAFPTGLMRMYCFGVAQKECLQ